jgi:hypothetical protein
MIALCAVRVSGLSHGSLRSRVAPDWRVPGLNNGGKDRMQYGTFIGLDVHKATRSQSNRVKTLVTGCSNAASASQDPDRPAPRDNNSATCRTRLAGK